SVSGSRGAEAQRCQTLNKSSLILPCSFSPLPLCFRCDPFFRCTASAAPLQYGCVTSIHQQGIIEMKKLVAVLVCVAAVVSVTARAQDVDAQAKALRERADLKRAFDYIDAHHDDILNEWKTITEINAPSGKEQLRAAFVKRLLDTYKLDRVYSDAVGNIIAIRQGTGGGKPVVFDAHLDTVFQEGLKIKAEIRNGK